VANAQDVACAHKNYRICDPRPSCKGDVLRSPLTLSLKTWLMARPQIHSDKKRTKIIRVRITEAERTGLVQAAKESGFSVSDYVRVKAINGKPHMRRKLPERQLVIAFLAELGKIGSNINQIARGINRRLAAGREPDVPADVIKHSLNAVETLTEHLIELLEHGHSRTDQG
jgi:hypothetical protein